MTQKKLQRELPAPLEYFTRGLLATTCLTVACGVSATAGTITEGTSPAPADFPNTLPAYLTPLGTTIVNGNIGSRFGESGNFDSADWFEFQGLTPGGSYNITGVSHGVDPFRAGFGENGVQASYFDTSSNLLGNLDLGENSGNPMTQSFVAPSDGNLVLDLFFRNLPEGACSACLGDWADTIPPYTITISTGTPEPGTVAGVGLGLGAIALAWRRRRAK